MVTGLRAEDVVLEHRSYCSAKAHRKHFAGDVLGYVTPVGQARGGWRTLKAGGLLGSAFSPPQAALTQGSSGSDASQQSAQDRGRALLHTGRAALRSPARRWPPPLAPLPAGPLVLILPSLPVEPARVRCRQDLRGQVHPRRPRVAAAEEAWPRDVRGHGPGRRGPRF